MSKGFTEKGGAENKKTSEGRQYGLGNGTRRGGGKREMEIFSPLQKISYRNVGKGRKRGEEREDNREGK